MYGRGGLSTGHGCEVTAGSWKRLKNIAQNGGKIATVKECLPNNVVFLAWISRIMGSERLWRRE